MWSSLRTKLMRNGRSISTCCFVILMALTRFSEGGYNASCNSLQFERYVYEDCIPHFNHSMEASDYLNTCPWPTFKGSYLVLNDCVGKVAVVTGCIEPSLKDSVFLEVHRKYFSLCSGPADPDGPVLMLLIMPSVITTLVFSALYTWQRHDFVKLNVGV
uniref:Si:ch73-193i22.1 n=1 Tax=Esox lucius TaxID=8010 RepID=A0A3P8YM75_ESOLU